MRDTIVDVRVVTPITTRGFRRPDDLAALEFPGIRVSHVEIATGPASIESEFEGAMSIPGTLEKIVAAEREGVDACIIDCMADPGLRAARELVAIPVLGPCQTAMGVAAMVAHKFSVVTVMRRLRAAFENNAALAGLGGKLASVRSVDIPVLALEEDLAHTRKILTDEAEIAVERDGAEAIIFGCTGLMGCAAAVREGLLARRIDVPVIDPIPTAIAVAASLVRAGLSQSKLTFPLPPEKELIGYDSLRRPFAVAAE